MTFSRERRCDELQLARMSPSGDGAPPNLAANIRRLLARAGLTVRGLAARSGVDLRTIKGLLRGGTQPHAKTLHRLAAGFDVPVDEFFQDPALLRHRLFDRRTNPMVDEAVAEHPAWFHGWSELDFDDLYSRFGHGGALTAEGARRTVEGINRRRLVQQRVALLLETDQAETLVGLVDVLYQRVLVPSGATIPADRPAEGRANL